MSIKELLKQLILETIREEYIEIDENLLSEGTFDKEKKSGLHECWKKLALLSDDDFIKPLTLELWGGKAGSRSIQWPICRSTYPDQVSECQQAE